MPSESIYRKTIPFTYYIKWTKLGISYYGCRYATGKGPDCLWKTYFTSSEYVRRFREMHGEPDIVKVTRTFDTVEMCREWESKFLLKTDAKNNPKLLNRSNPGSYGIAKFKPGIIPSNAGAYYYIEKLVKDTCDLFSLEYPKTSEPLKDRVWVNYKFTIFLYFYDKPEADEFLRHNPEWNRGRIPTEQKDRQSIILTGKKKPPRTKEHLEKIGDGNRGKKKPNSGHSHQYWYTNGIDNMYVDKNKQPPTGFTRGRTVNKRQI